jgi:hypothetical protein
MFEVRLGQIVEPEPEQRFRFGVRANPNLGLRTEPFFIVNNSRTLNSETFLHIYVLLVLVLGAKYKMCEP